MLKNITYLSIFPAMGLCCCTRAFSSGASEGCAPLVCPGSRCIGSSRRSTGSRAHSVAVPHAIRAPRACGLLPSQGSGQCPLHWQTDSQPLGHQGDRTAHDRGCPCRMRLQKGPAIKVLFLAVLCGMRLLSSLTRDLTCILSSEKTGF